MVQVTSNLTALKLNLSVEEILIRNEGVRGVGRDTSLTQPVDWPPL